MFESLEVLGRARSLERLDTAIERLAASRPRGPERLSALVGMTDGSTVRSSHSEFAVALASRGFGGRACYDDAAHSGVV